MSIETQKNELLDLVNTKNSSELTITEVEMAVGATTEGKTVLHLTPAADSKYYAEDDVYYSKLDLEKYFHGITLVLDLKSDQLTAGQALKLIAERYGLDLVDADIKDPDADIGIGWNYPILEHVQVNATDESYRWSGHVEFTARYFWRAIDRIITERKLDGLTYLETSDGSLTSLQLTSYPLEFKTAAAQLSSLKTGDTISQAIAAAVNSDYNTAYGTQFDTDGAILGAAKVVNAGTAAELGFTGKDGLNVVIAESVKDAINKFAGQIHIFFSANESDSRTSIADMFSVDTLLSGALSQKDGYYNDLMLQYASMFAKGGYFYGDAQPYGNLPVMPIGILETSEDPELITAMGTEVLVQGAIVDGVPTVTLSAASDSDHFKGNITITYPAVGNTMPMAYSDGSLDPAHLLDIYKTKTGLTDATAVPASFLVNIIMSCGLSEVAVAGAVLLESSEDGMIQLRTDAVWDNEGKLLTADSATELFGDGAALVAETAQPWIANNNYVNANVQGSSDTNHSTYALNPLYAALAPFAARYVKNDEEIRHGIQSNVVYPEALFGLYGQALLDLINVGAEHPNTLDAFDYYVKKGRNTQGYLSNAFTRLDSTENALYFEMDFGRYSDAYLPTNLGSTQGYLKFTGMANETLEVATGVIPADIADFDFNALVEAMGWMKAMHVACAICDYDSEGIVKINDKVVITDLGNGLRSFTVADDGQFESDKNRRGYTVVEKNYTRSQVWFRNTSIMANMADFLANSLAAEVTHVPWQLTFGILAHPDSTDDVRKMALKALIPLLGLGDLTDWSIPGNVSKYMDIVGAIDAGELVVSAITRTDSITGDSIEVSNVTLRFPAANRVYQGLWSFEFPTPTTGKFFTFGYGFSGGSVSHLDILQTTTDIGMPDFAAAGTWGAQVLNIYQYIDRHAVTITGKDVTVADTTAYPSVTWTTDGTSGFNGTSSPAINANLSVVTADPKIHGLLAINGPDITDRIVPWAYAMARYNAVTAASDDTHSITWTVQNMFNSAPAHSLNSSSNAITVSASVLDTMGYSATVTADITGVNTAEHSVDLNWDNYRDKALGMDASEFFRPDTKRDGIDWFDLFSDLGAEIPVIFNMLFEADRTAPYGFVFSSTVVVTESGSDLLITNSDATHWPVTLKISNSAFDPNRLTFTPASNVDANLVKSQVFDGVNYRDAMGFFMTPAVDEAGELTAVLKGWATYGSTLDQSTTEAKTINWVATHRDIYTFIVDRKVTGANSMDTTLTVDLHCNELDVTLSMTVSMLDTTTNNQTLSWNAVRANAPGKTAQAFFADSTTDANSILAVFSGYLNPEIYSTLFVAEGTEYKRSPTVVVNGGSSLAQITNSAAANPAVDGDVAPLPQMLQITNANQS